MNVVALQVDTKALQDFVLLSASWIKSIVFVQHSKSSSTEFAYNVYSSIMSFILCPVPYILCVTKLRYRSLLFVHNVFFVCCRVIPHGNGHGENLQGVPVNKPC